MASVQLEQREMEMRDTDRAEEPWPPQKWIGQWGNQAETSASEGKSVEWAMDGMEDAGFGTSGLRGGLRDISLFVAGYGSA